MIHDKLIEDALKARELSYCPYSGFSVGAALLCEDGTEFIGCNIENAAFGPTICAERTAIFKAVSSGKRQFQAIAIAGGKKGERPVNYAYPCGVCRQVMREFCKEDFIIYVVKSPAEYQKTTLKELLPSSFGPENL